MTNEHDRPGSSGSLPQYGEYAPPGWSWTPPVEPAREPEPERPANAAADRRPRAAGASPHPRDRVATIILLALGVFFAVPSLLNPGSFLETLQDLYRQQGIGEYTSIGLARSLGVLSGVAQTAIVAAAMVIAVRRLRLGRRAVLVPIIGIVVSAVVALAIVVVAMLGDPAFAEYVARSSSVPGMAS